MHVADGDLAMTQKWMITKLRLEVADARDDWEQFIDRVVARDDSRQHVQTCPWL